MNKEKILMMIKRNRNRIVIIFVIFLSLLLIGQCFYYFFCLPKENEKIEAKIDGIQYEIENVSEIARKDFLLFLDHLKADEKEAFRKKKVDCDHLDENIETLKDQGIWNVLRVKPGVNFESYYCSLQDSQKAFLFQLDELLEKVEKEKDLASFREGLEKLRQEHQKYTDVFAEFGYRIQEETKEPMPFFASYAGIGISVAISSIVSFLIFQLLVFHQKKENKDPDLITLLLLSSSFYLFLLFLVFSLINCLLSLKMSPLKEIYKHYFCNKVKTFSLFFIPVLAMFILFLVFILNLSSDDLNDDGLKEEEHDKENVLSGNAIKLENPKASSSYIAQLRRMQIRSYQCRSKNGESSKENLSNIDSEKEKLNNIDSEKEKLNNIDSEKPKENLDNTESEKEKLNNNKKNLNNIESEKEKPDNNIDNKVKSQLEIAREMHRYKEKTLPKVQFDRLLNRLQTRGYIIEPEKKIKQEGGRRNIILNS